MNSIQHLSSGGMGSVFKAIEEPLGREVAIKAMPTPALDEPSPLRYEAYTLSKLDHPNIVKLLSYIEDEGVALMVTEFIPGTTLAENLSHSPLSFHDSLILFNQVCKTIIYAHSNGIAHRDIKPSNIIIDNSGIPKLIDFGISYCQCNEIGKPLPTIRDSHTPEYSPPEAKDRRFEFAEQHDVYSLGVLFYELITGKLPLGRYHAPTNVVARLPQWTNQIAYKALHADQNSRFQDADSLLLAVENTQKIAVIQKLAVRAVCIFLLVCFLATFGDYGDSSDLNPPHTKAFSRQFTNSLGEMTGSCG